MIPRGVAVLTPPGAAPFAVLLLGFHLPLNLCPHAESAIDEALSEGRGLDPVAFITKRPAPEGIRLGRDGLNFGPGSRDGAPKRSEVYMPA